MDPARDLARSEGFHPKQNGPPHGFNQGRSVPEFALAFRLFDWQPCGNGLLITRGSLKVALMKMSCSGILCLSGLLFGVAAAFA